MVNGAKSLTFLTLIYWHKFNILVLLLRFLVALINVIVAFLPANLMYMYTYHMLSSLKICFLAWEKERTPYFLFKMFFSPSSSKNAPNPSSINSVTIQQIKHPTSTSDNVWNEIEIMNKYNEVEETESCVSIQYMPSPFLHKLWICNSNILIA